MENMHLWRAGRNTYFDRQINIMSWSDDYVVNVGRYCSIGRNVTFFLHANHRPDWVTTSSMVMGPVTPELDEYLKTIGHPSCKGNIEIGNDVWIGSGAMIMSGIKIGDGAVIAAGSVVTKNVKPYSVVGGNPANFLYSRFNEEAIEALLEIKWWNWPESQVRKFSKLLWSSNVKEFIDLAKKVGPFAKIELISIEEDGLKVTVWNSTGDALPINAKFVDLTTEELLYQIDSIIYPDSQMWVACSTNRKKMGFVITNVDTNEVLLNIQTRGKHGRQIE